jgi:hypothetical protein
MAKQQQANPNTQTKPGRGGQGLVQDQGVSDKRDAGRAQEEEADDAEFDDDELDEDDEDEDEDEEA